MSAEITQAATAFVFVLMRVGGFVVAMPIFRREMVPRTVKAGLIMSLAMFWFPGMASNVADQYGTAEVIVYGIREVVLGVTISMLLGFFLLPARIAGSWVSQEIGLSMGQQADPVTRENSTVVSQVFTSIATLMFLAMDLHHSLFRVLGLTFEHIPFGTSLNSERVARLSVDSLTVAHEYGLAIAAPVGVFLFLLSVILFLLNKASPQINLFSVGLPLRLAVGFALILLLLPETCLLIARSLQHMLDFFLASI